MKKLLLVLAIAVSGFTANAQSVDVKVDVLGFLFNVYGAGADFNLNDEMSVGLELGYYSFDFDGLSSGFSGFSAASDFRFYFNPDREGNTNFFAAPYAKFRTASQDGISYQDNNGDFQETTRSNTGLALGIMTGRKWVTRSGFMFDTYAGIGKFLVDSYSYGTAEAEEYYAEFEEAVDGLPSLDFRLGLAIGWRF